MQKIVRTISPLLLFTKRFNNSLDFDTTFFLAFERIHFFWSKNAEDLRLRLLTMAMRNNGKSPTRVCNDFREREYNRRVDDSLDITFTTGKSTRNVRLFLYIDVYLILVSNDDLIRATKWRLSKFATKNPLHIYNTLNALTCKL